MKRIIVGLVLLSVYLWGLSASAIDLKELSIDYKNFAWVNDKARNPLIYPEHPKEGINLNINTDIIDTVYWNSTVEAITTDAQYRSIGLETRLGIRISPTLEVGYYHHSQHLIDRPHYYMDKFPSEDAIEIKIYIFGPKKRGDSVLE